MYGVSANITYGTIIFVILMELLVGLSVVLALDPYTDSKRKKMFATIFVLVFALIMQNLGEFWLVKYHHNPLLRTVLATLGYSLRPLILLSFAYLTFPEGKHTVAWILVVLNVLMHCTSFFTDIVFTIDEVGWRGGPLNFWCLMTSGILLVYLVGLMLFKFKWRQFKEIIFHVFWMTLIVAGIIADSLWNESQWVDYLTVSVTIATVLSYMWFHQRFVHEYETRLMEARRMQLVLSQIQPHFIYNTLSSIRSIEGNPEETKRAITEFANYIRGNLSALDGKELIPFSEELDFVKDYVSLQQRRFPNRINVIYDITDKDFMVPPLTVQILVENAIKHGILVRYDSGLVIVQTRLERNNHVIVVSDDGVGFDVKKLDNTDRVGLRAVRNRLEYYLEGTLFIESEVGHGTDVVIEIPYSSQKKQAEQAKPEASDKRPEKPETPEKREKNDEDTDRR